MDARRVLSDVTNCLQEAHRERYVEKLRKIGSIDPYLLPKAMFTPLLTATCVPNLGYPDIYNYLVSSVSAYSHSALKNYKSLEAYKYFVAGFVKDVLLYKSSANIFVIMGKVVHSQRLNDTTLSPWVAVRSDGDVLCAHCTCMAGLGETCSHIAATLFSVETGVRIRSGTTCTSLACSWLAPSTNQNVPYAEAYKIDFTSPCTKMKQTTGGLMKEPKKQQSTSSQPDYDSFYKSLCEAGSNSAVLSVLPGYADKFVPTGAKSHLPIPLSNLFAPENRCLTSNELSSKADAVFSNMMVTETQVASVEEMTRSQWKSQAWFRYRQGRITASNLKAATRANVTKPPKSLIQKICYPASHRFSTRATRWGCDHEEKVSKDYEHWVKASHHNVSVSKCGFFMYKDNPFIGASPDGLISCDCCGLGTLEVKCPFCMKDSSILEATEKKDFCLETINAQTRLKRDHSYFYQVQCQLGVTGRSFCDFCVWTGSEMFIERIFLDQAFWQENVEKASSFVKRCILPELLAKVYSQPTVITPPGQSGNPHVCYCKTQDENKTLIECSAKDCTIGKFHRECVGLTRKRKGWFCLSCRVSLRRQKGN